MLVTQGAEEVFPKGLFPAGIFGAGEQGGGLVFKADLGGAIQYRGQPGLIQFLQRSGAPAALVFGQARIVFQRERQFRQW